MKFTAHEFVKYDTSLRAQAITVATVNGLAVNRKGFEEALVVADVGPLGGTTPTLDVKVQEADDDGTGAPGTFADVTSATFPQFTATIDDRHVVARLDLSKRKKWLRLVATGAGTTPTGSFSAGFALLAANVLKVSQTNSVAFNI